MFVLKTSRVILQIPKKLQGHCTRKIHWKKFASVTSGNEQIPVFTFYGKFCGKTWKISRHTSSATAQPSLKQTSELVKKKRHKENQNEEANKKTARFYDSQCLYNIPDSGKFGDLVYTGKRVVPLEKQVPRYYSGVIMSGTVMHLLCKFGLSIPLTDQLFIIVPTLLCHYFFITRGHMQFAMRYILCMYYDRESKLFTSVTWTRPGLLTTEFRLQRFSIEDVKRPTGSDHNIVLKQQKRVIENDIDCFIDKNVYAMLRDRMQQEKM